MAVTCASRVDVQKRLPVKATAFIAFAFESLPFDFVITGLLPDGCIEGQLVLDFISFTNVISMYEAIKGERA